MAKNFKNEPSPFDCPVANLYDYPVDVNLNDYIAGPIFD